VGILGSELVGLVPRAALDPQWLPLLKLHDFTEDQVVEAKLEKAMKS